MIIHFSPAMSDGSITLSKNGDVLTVNGDALDFSDLPEGGEYPAEAIDNEFIVGEVKRVNGKVHITVLLPYSNPNPPRLVAFPTPLLVGQDGAIALPECRDAEIENAD